MMRFREWKRAMHWQTSVLQRDWKRVNFTEWFSRTVMLPNGWKVWRMHWKSDRMLNWKNVQIRLLKSLKKRSRMTVI